MPVKSCAGQFDTCAPPRWILHGVPFDTGTAGPEVFKARTFRSQLDVPR